MLFFFLPLPYSFAVKRRLRGATSRSETMRCHSYIDAQRTRTNSTRVLCESARLGERSKCKTSVLVKRNCNTPFPGAGASSFSLQYIISVLYSTVLVLVLAHAPFFFHCKPVCKCSAPLTSYHESASRGDGYSRISTNQRTLELELEKPATNNSTNVRSSSTCPRTRYPCR